MIKKDAKDLIEKRAKEIILINLFYFIIFGERGWKILTGKIKLLK
jgi:hypothetical protein